MSSDVKHDPYTFPLGPHWIAQSGSGSPSSITLTPLARHLEFELDLSAYEVNTVAMIKLLKKSLEEMLQVLHEQHVEPMLVGAFEHKRWTVYTGSAGVAYTLWRVKRCGIVECPVDVEAIRQIASTAVKSSDADDATLL